MSKDIKRHVNTDSAAFSAGVEAGLNSEENTNNWKAGNDLGQALKDEGENKALADENLKEESSIPLFMRKGSKGNKGNAQDEKDETEE